jgi:phosphoglycerate dehydrogenase-like enzyme
MGAAVSDAIRAFPDVEVIELSPGPPPAETVADVFFGGYTGWDDIITWLDATGVRWVQLTGTGIDNVPTSVFNNRVVTCARGASAVPISEWVLAAILARAKRFPDIFLHEPPEYWNFPIPPFDAVSGSTLALFGLGGIGAAIAHRALPFGMRVVALRRTDAPSPIPGVELVRSIDDLVADADHLVLAAPSTPRTRGIIDADVLGKVKPGVHLVNIARGTLVDQDALHTALDDGRVAWATLDTVDPEPLPAEHWLYTHPHVRVSAHISWFSPAMIQSAVEIFVDNLGRYLRGDPLLHVVDVDEGY